MRLLLIIITISLSLDLLCQIPANVKDIELIEHDRIEKNIGQTFPAFRYKSLDGQSYSEVNLVNKITVINFWFELCSPCVAELDALNDLFFMYKKNPKFQFISFTIDSPEVAKESVEKYQLKYPVISISDSECFRLNCNLGFPTTMIIDETGKIKILKTGGHTDKLLIKKDIENLIQIIKQHLSE